MAVDIPINIDVVEEGIELPSHTYALDLDAGRIAGFVDEVEAVKQSIRSTLLTPRFECLIYDDQYGSELKTLLTGKDSTLELIEDVLPRLIEEALSTDARILGVSNFAFEFQEESMFVSFSVSTVFGEITMAEVI
ncbi:MAG: DUF2634 domain-containing protein [Oscillospiraceae bacterium]|jgi:hypothetical protein|nr:DUF2634 domain-containing protein [Oscillospiraceae bacterium]